MLAAVSCGKSNGPDTLNGTATFPEQVGGGPVGNTPYSVLDLNQKGAPLVAQGASSSDGSWFVPGAKGASLAVIFEGQSPQGRVRVSGLTRPDETGFEKNLTGQTDIACEAGLTAVLQGIIFAPQLTGTVIAQLEETAGSFVGTTNFLSPASVSASAAQVRRKVFGH
jgi:hypothetical protein